MSLQKNSPENKIDIIIGKEGLVSIDLGGELDKSCCGCEASTLIQDLKKMGITLKQNRVHCRLPLSERIRAKAIGVCNFTIANPLKADSELAKRRIG